MRFSFAICVALSLFAADEDVAAWVRSEGGKAVVDRNGGIVEINLSGTWVSDASLSRLTKLKSLAVLRLGHTRLTDAAFEHLAPLATVRELDLYFAEFFTDDGLARLKAWRRLERVDLRGTKVTSKSFETISQWTALRSLDLSNTQIDDSGMEMLEQLPALETLSIGGTRISAAGLAMLKLVPKLATLDVGGVQRVDSGEWGLPLNSATLGEIGALPSLRRLTLQGAVLADTGADRPGLKESVRSKVTGLARLCQLSNIESLDLSRTPVDSEALAELRGCRALRELRIASTQLDDTAIDSIAALPSLRLVDLDATRMTASGVQRLRGLRTGLTVRAESATR